jgi:hypothetical protein
MIAKYIAFTLFFLTFIISKPSLAMSKLGHQVICQLAFEHLSQSKQDEISSLINTIPKQHKKLINRYNYKKEDKNITFANACTWADAVKRLEKFRTYNSWHYMNVSRSYKKIGVNECKKNCLPQAILKHQKILSQSKKPYTWERAQALLFLGHWLGDVHQPLHISFSDDLGGNKVKFSHADTKCANLHRYWDECIMYKGKQSKAKWLKALNEQWNQHSQPNWQARQVWGWADESFQLAIKPSFMYCQLDSHGSCQKPITKIKLPPNYLSQFQPVIEHRLVLAAQRLVMVLEESL